VSKCGIVGQNGITFYKKDYRYGDMGLEYKKEGLILKIRLIV
jgi:hypothetical protein